MANSTKQTVHVIFSDGMLGIEGVNFSTIFSYERGGLESLNINHHKWLADIIRPQFWRATTDNDNGNNFSVKSALWLAATFATRCTKMEYALDDAAFVPVVLAPATNAFSNDIFVSRVAVRCTYTPATTPTTTMTLTYTIDATGQIAVKAHFAGNKALPELPVLAVQLTLPTPCDGFDYFGLAGETYPDRMANDVASTHHVLKMPVTPYVRPQECGMHMNSAWVKLKRSTSRNPNRPNQPDSLVITGSPLNFACLPYTAFELENARHQYELPPVTKTVVTIAGKVRGVGGIDSWGSDVLPQYRIDAQNDYEFSFVINPANFDN